MFNHLMKIYRGLISSSRCNIRVLRSLCSESNESKLTSGEKQIQDVLTKSFPKATAVHVSDISGGCGAMFEVYVVSEEFEGKRTVMQHRMVTEALKEEIKDMHGLRISTAIKEDS